MCSAFVLQILNSSLETKNAGIGDKYSGLINFGEFKVHIRKLDWNTLLVSVLE